MALVLPMSPARPAGFLLFASGRVALSRKDLPMLCDNFRKPSPAVELVAYCPCCGAGYRKSRALHVLLRPRICVDCKQQAEELINDYGEGALPYARSRAGFPLGIT